MNNFAKKVTSWGQNIGKDIIRLARFGDIDAKYKQFIEDIKSAKRPRNAKEGDMIRDYSGSSNRLSTVEVKDNLSPAIFDDEIVIIPKNL